MGLSRLLDLQLHVQSVPITTEVVSLNPTHGEVYSIQHYEIKFVSDLQQIGGFLRVLLFPLPIKVSTYDITEILLKVALHNINYKPQTILKLFAWIIYNLSSLLKFIVKHTRSATLHKESDI